MRPARVDFIFNTLAALPNWDIFAAFNRDGVFCLLGLHDHLHPLSAVRQLIFKCRNFAGFSMCGIKEIQEMLDFCAELKIVLDIQIILKQIINEAYERMLKSGVNYRFVTDMSSLEIA
ncbi:hypothetical protein [Methylicorpusculum sp.]|uniref:hypothetical protein n=1 Tax=Methylicorpusculum sp. TaxID=2713644 RepID=UPI0027314525|nr:hypothetical protein [Methylicorpusculum sp.]MDP2178702.1 hypothetical protein [Methylicorpusculum sp.]MDP3530337.1 hypothetical protein [Methylicorpusculum sp.]